MRPESSLHDSLATFRIRGMLSIRRIRYDGSHKETDCIPPIGRSLQQANAAGTTTIVEGAPHTPQPPELCHSAPSCGLWH